MISLNGKPLPLPEDAGLLTALAEVGIDQESRGVAVAVDGEVVPRSQWPSRLLADGARVEALTAMQGG